MAKGGLNPGADATIAAAAYRAGMAGVPKDLSTTFKGIATSYASAMDKMGAGLAKAAEVGATLAAPMIDKAVKDYKTSNSTVESVDDGYGDGLTNELFGYTDINDKEHEGALETTKRKYQEFTSWAPGPKRKKARLKWRQERDNLLGGIRKLQEGTFINEEAIAEGSFNISATGSVNSLFQSAIMEKGNPLPEDHPYPGVSVKSVIVDGKIELHLVDVDGEAISGISDDGVLQYVDGKELK